MKTRFVADFIPPEHTSPARSMQVDFIPAISREEISGVRIEELATNGYLALRTPEKTRRMKRETRNFLKQATQPGRWLARNSPACAVNPEQEVKEYDHA